jgi:hypothetical protein
MKADTSTPDNDLSSIPGEFRENYRFLSELINCKHKNTTLTNYLGSMFDPRLKDLTKRLNRRQVKIIKQFIQFIQTRDEEDIAPPVPEELEAAIRIKKKNSWLPWEDEAIRKIDRWRSDVASINSLWMDVVVSKTVVLGSIPKDQA